MGALIETGEPEESHPNILVGSPAGVFVQSVEPADRQRWCVCTVAAQCTAIAAAARPDNSKVGTLLDPGVQRVVFLPPNMGLWTRHIVASSGTRGSIEVFNDHPGDVGVHA